MLEVNREDEFAPLKNANAAGTECPDTSRDAIYTLHSKWVIQNGGAITTSSPTGPVRFGSFMMRNFFCCLIGFSLLHSAINFSFVQA